MKRTPKDSGFMVLEMTRKGAHYTAECNRCSATMHVHEFATWDNNNERDGLEDGSLTCPECMNGKADPETFRQERNCYAARFSAPGFMDCTEWTFGTNKRTLEREVRDLYEGEG
jgi:hypothetical protein